MSGAFFNRWNVAGLLFVVLTIVGASFLGSAAIADTCTKTSLRCTKTGPRTVAGLVYPNTCLEVERVEKCTQSNPVNECGALDARKIPNSQTFDDGQCKLLENQCTRYTLGKCVSWRREYRCWNAPRDMAPAVLEARTYHNFDEQVQTDCGGLEADGNCSYVNTVTLQGAATRDINTRLIARGWWKQQRNFDCTNPNFENTCGDYEANPICTEVGEGVCLEWDSNGNCTYEEVSYECNSDPSFNANCEPISVCVGDNCAEIEEEPGTDFPEVASWLNFLDRAADENNCEADPDVDPDDFGAEDCVSQEHRVCEANNTVENTATGIVAPLVCGPVTVSPTDLEVFSGAAMSCGMNNIISCCNASGYNNCSIGEFDLLSYREAKTTHYLGTRCTDKIFGICVYWRRDYCVYKSKFGRVFQEQAHLQTGDQFRARGASDRCPGLTIDQLHQIETGEMDFSEVYGDMMNDAELPVQDELIEQLNNQLGVQQDAVQSTFE